MRTLLAGERDLELVEAADAEQLARVVAERRPDVVLIDLNLPPDGAFAALRRALDICPVRAVIWSFEPTAATVLAAIRAGAVGYLRKETSPDGLLRAIRGTLRGEAPLGRDFASMLVEEIHEVADRERAREQAAVLSAREREVLELVARGASNREIAGRLVITEGTVKNHISNILSRLGLRDRTQAAIYAREKGLL